MTDTNSPSWRQELETGWRISPKGNPHIQTKQYSATIYPDQMNQGNFSFVIVYAGAKPTYSKGRYTEALAMDAVFDAIAQHFNNDMEEC